MCIGCTANNAAIMNGVDCSHDVDDGKIDDDDLMPDTELVDVNR